MKFALRVLVFGAPDKRGSELAGQIYLVSNYIKGKVLVFAVK